jgi:hypothetical protein
MAMAFISWENNIIDEIVFYLYPREKFLSPREKINPRLNCFYPREKFFFLRNKTKTFPFS